MAQRVNVLLWLACFSCMLLGSIHTPCCALVEPQSNGPPSSQDAKNILTRVPPTPAEQASTTFQVLDGFRMELVVSEPLVTSPVAMAFDEYGRAFVCEMRDYPYTDKARHKPSQENPTDQPIGRIRMLEDTNGDGRYDRSSIFAEDLSWPTGIACWKGGVFVAATPDIWYLKDHNGDGIADERSKVLSGFRKFNVQATMNTLTWGLDNHIHGAGGSNGGQVRSTHQPQSAPAILSKNDFRMDPVSGTIELLSGGARFGVTFDDWGSRFLCNIRNPAQHVILPSRYMARNRDLVSPNPIADMAESGDQLPVYRISKPEPWREVRAKRWAGERDIVMPKSELVGAGVVTSSSGITSYRGAAYPEKYRDNVFVTECAGNLLYRLKLEPDGVTFKALRVDGAKEMVASTDNWFRPVNFVNAPDGTLYVLDMYRENIEHPWSIPDDIHALVDLEAGRDRGRIWRLAPPGFVPRKPPNLGDATSLELVATLENPNAWWRDTAQRLFFERQDPHVRSALHQMVLSGQTPQARVTALWVLHGMKELTKEDLMAGLRDSFAGVRENALQLAETKINDPDLLAAILPLAMDPSPRVRFQTAFTLGESKDPRAFEGLVTIAKHDAADRWIRNAVLSSTSGRCDALLVRLISDRDFSSRSVAASILQELSQVVGVRGKATEIQTVLDKIDVRDMSISLQLRHCITGIGQGLKRSGKNLRLLGLTGSTKQTVEKLFNDAAATALDETKSLEARVDETRLLAFDDFASCRTTLLECMAPQQPQELQRAAISTLGSFQHPEIGTLLLTHWRAQWPAVRTEVVSAMLSVRSRALPLLKAIESGLVPANQIPFAQRGLLMRSTVTEVKDLAERLFGNALARPRNEVIDKYRSSITQPGDVLRGKRIYERACMNCHRAGDTGTSDIGPNLANVRAWNPDQLLVNILDPNREVAPSFTTYNVLTYEGRVISGLMVEDSEVSLSIKRSDGVVETLLRREVEEMVGTGLSLMPEGMEANLSPKEMEDLIAFLLAPSPTSKEAR